MPRLGADIEQLQELARALRDGARRVDDAHGVLESRRRAVTWTGPDARRFAQDWQGVHAPALRAMGDRWRHAAATLDAHCDEQRRASDAGVTGMASVTGMAGATLGAGGAGGAAGTVTALTPLPAPAHGPRREVQVLAGTAVTAAGARIALDHEVTVSWADDGAVDLEVIERRAAGARASLGAEAGISSAGAPLAFGAAAGASVELGQVVRRTYAVEEGALWATIARVEAELAAGRAWEGTRAVPGMGPAVDLAPVVVPLWDRALDLLPGPDVDLQGALDRISIAPEPQHVETLTEIAVQVGASASLAALFGLAAGGELTGTARIGTLVPGRATADGGGGSGDPGGSGSGGDSGTQVIELEGELAAAVQGSWLDRFDVAPYEPGDSMAAVRIELPQGTGDDRPATVSWERHLGSTTERGSVLVDPSGVGAELTDQLRRAAGALSAGRVDAAWDLLRDLDVGDAAGPVTLDRFDVVDRTGRASSSIGLGATVELAGEGGVRTLTRRP
ncbi:MAG: hypothetical protein ACYC2O_12705 [Microthrixaceae bacterium]